MTTSDCNQSNGRATRHRAVNIDLHETRVRELHLVSIKRARLITRLAESKSRDRRLLLKQSRYSAHLNVLSLRPAQNHTRAIEDRSSRWHKVSMPSLWGGIRDLLARIEPPTTLFPEKTDHRVIRVKSILSTQALFTPRKFPSEPQSQSSKPIEGVSMKASDG